MKPDPWCMWCGDPLPDGKRRKFCCNQCGGDYHDDLKRERKAKARAGKTCAECGTKFDGVIGYQIYCGKQCCTKAKRRMARERLQETGQIAPGNPTPKHPR